MGHQSSLKLARQCLRIDQHQRMIMKGIGCITAVASMMTSLVQALRVHLQFPSPKGSTSVMHRDSSTRKATPSGRLRLCWGCPIAVASSGSYE